MNGDAKTSDGCAYCEQPATTKDHIPPKGIFPRPRPSDLITVPSCERHNSGASLDDELFRNFVVLREELAGHPQASRTAAIAMRGLHRPERPGLRRQLLSTLREVDLESPAGLYLGTASEFAHSGSSILSVSKRITRGLYYHHFGQRVPAGHSVVCVPQRNLPAGDREIWLELSESIDPTVHSVGDGAFKYRFEISSEDPEISVWVLVYFDVVVFYSTVMPIEDGDIKVREHE